jgi:hypothetical protein
MQMAQWFDENNEPLIGHPGFDDGRTKQGFKDQTDINRILARAAKGEAISHLAKYEHVYGDFSDIGDLLEAHEKLMRGQAVFDDLPGELRREFGNSPKAFFEYVNDPKNIGDLDRLIPGLAKPGDQMKIQSRSQSLNQGIEPQAAPEPPPQAPSNAPDAPPASPADPE